MAKSNRWENKKTLTSTEKQVKRRLQKRKVAQIINRIRSVLFIFLHIFEYLSRSTFTPADGGVISPEYIWRTCRQTTRKSRIRAFSVKTDSTEPAKRVSIKLKWKRKRKKVKRSHEKSRMSQDQRVEFNFTTVINTSLGWIWDDKTPNNEV